MLEIIGAITISCIVGFFSARKFLFVAEDRRWWANMEMGALIPLAIFSWLAALVSAGVTFAGIYAFWIH